MPNDTLRIRKRATGDSVEASEINPLFTSSGADYFPLEITLTHTPAAYEVRDIINAAAAGTLPYFDMSAYGVNRRFVVNSLFIISSYGAAATKLQVDAKLYNIADPMGANGSTDNTAFNPTYENVKGRMTGFSNGDTEPLPALGNNAYMVALWENKFKIVKSDANGRIYLALLAANAYTATADEKLYAVLGACAQ